MKKILILSILVSLFTFLISCSESLLDLSPTNKYTEDIFWQSETQADAGLAACYEDRKSVV